MTRHRTWPVASVPGSDSASPESGSPESATPGTARRGVDEPDAAGPRRAGPGGGALPSEPAPASAPGPASAGPDGGDPPRDAALDPGTDPQARYQPGGLLGEGGMGKVVLTRDRVLDRDVARKELSPRLRRRPDAAARLLREARITAQLDHPGIVAVHDLGRLDDGRPYYTMRLIRGRSLAAALEAARDLPARLALLRPFLSACEAVGYAHANGVIHRDLKPSNIMIGGFGEIQVVDWGLARRVEDPLDSGEPGEPGATSAMTADGTVFGTPAYMSPEQARGERATTRSDTWSLGACLYALLAGQPPFAGNDAETVLAEVRARPAPPVREVCPEVPPALAAIAERALQRDADARYRDAGDLAADLARWFDGGRVQAHEYSPVELLARFVRAWRLPLAALTAATVAAALAGGLAWSRILAERDRALAAEATTRDALATSDRDRAGLLVKQAQAAVLVDDRHTAESLARAALALADSPEARSVLAAFARSPGPVPTPLPSPPGCGTADLSDDGALLLCAGPQDVALWEVEPLRRRWSRAGTAELVSLQGGLAWVNGRDLLLRGLDLETGDARESYVVGAVTDIVSAPGAGWAANPLRLYELAGAAGLLERATGCEGTVSALGLLPGGGVHVLCSDGTLVRDGRGVPTDAHGNHEAGALAWLPPPGSGAAPPAGRGPPANEAPPAVGEPGLLVGSIRGRLSWIDPATGRTRSASDSSLGFVRTVEPSPDGALVAAIGANGGPGVWSVAARDWVARLAPSTTRAVAWQAPRELLVLGDELVRWRLPDEPRPYVLSAPTGLSALALSPDGGLLAMALGEGKVRLLRTSDGAEVATATTGRGTLAVVKSVQFSPDGRWLLGCTPREDGLLALDRDRGWAPVDLGASWGARRVVFLRGAALLGQYASTLVRLAPLGGSAPVSARPGASPPEAPPKAERFAVPEEALDLATDTTGQHAVLLGKGGGVWRLDGQGRPVEPPLARDPALVAVDVDEHGAVLLVREGPTELVDPAGHRRTLGALGAGVRDAALSPDGTLIASAHLDGTVRVHATDTGHLVGHLVGHRDRVGMLEWSADGRWIASASWDQTARLWDVASLLDGT